MTKLSELDEALVALKDQLTVAKDDILVRISELEATLADIPLTPEAEAALAELRASADAIDAIA